MLDGADDLPVPRETRLGSQAARKGNLVRGTRGRPGTPGRHFPSIHSCRVPIMSIIVTRTGDELHIAAGARRLEAQLQVHGEAKAMLDGTEISIVRDASGKLIVVPVAANEASTA